jgi:hypothetical protein
VRGHSGQPQQDTGTVSVSFTASPQVQMVYVPASRPRGLCSGLQTFVPVVLRAMQACAAELCCGMCILTNSILHIPLIRFMSV